MRLQQIELTNSTIDMLDQLKYVHLNGDVILAGFIEDSPSSSVDTDSSPNSLMTWLGHPNIQDIMSDLHIPAQLDIPTDLRLIDQSTLETELTQRLMRGGAYQRFLGNEAGARELARNFVGGLFGEVKKVQIAISQQPWSRWFMGIAWDFTMVAHDLESGRRWLLTITDTD